MMVTRTFIHCNQEILEWCWASEHELIVNPHWTSCYLLDGLLIDSGAPGGIDDLNNFINSLGAQKIEACVLTHTHEDHAGGAHMLHTEHNVPIYASEKAIPILKTGYTYPEYRQIAWGEEGVLPVDVEIIPNQITSKSGKYIFDVLPIPGHAPEQVALIEKKQQWVFAADGVQIKYKRIFGKTSSIQEDISLIYQSIQDIRHITEGMTDLKVFLPGGRVLGEDFLDEKIREIWNLRQNVHELDNQDYSVEEITQKIFGEEDIFDIFTNGALSKKNLILSILKWPTEK